MKLFSEVSKRNKWGTNNFSFLLTSLWRGSKKSRYSMDIEDSIFEEDKLKEETKIFF